MTKKEKEQMGKRYLFQNWESKIYKMWEKGGCFKPNFRSKSGRFCIIMPPPNANASLHIGHAVFVTLEDIMIRYHRMKGEAVLWVPGADHAGFETQVVFERHLEKEGKSRFQFSRKTLYKMMLRFTQKNKKIMEKQLRCLGASCDWSREKFTLDPEVVSNVYQTFKCLFKDGLVYRGKRVINWCSHHQTSLSDLEIVHQKQKTKLTYIKYPFVGDSKKFVIVATTRPETMLGDTAVAVNPKDKRYQYLLKKGIKLRLPLTERIIPLIADKAVDIDFGTGAVKITPAHDPIDFEIGRRHNLEIIPVIARNGRMNEAAGSDYLGLDIIQAREKVIENLKKLGLLEKEEDYSYLLPVCYKCKRPVERLTSDQWFLKIAPLAKKAVESVRKKEVKFVSDHFQKIFFNWMNNIRDWNISRQIVWGIRIPVWYCQEKKNRKCLNRQGIIVSEKKPAVCPWCGSKKLKEETDTFDTWFSSGQWPFIVLGYPRGKDYKNFYPTSVMETGWDILFFWVARMLMLGIYRTGQVPFRYVYLHGLVRDKNRQKMSKSKGNVINPLEVLEKYGADALRMTLVFGSSNQKDIVVSEEKIAGQQKFVTKIWNAARFIIQNLKDFHPEKISRKDLSLTQADRWIIKETEKAAQKISRQIESFNFHLAAEEVYHFFWHKFCDKTIEDIKSRLWAEKADFKEVQTCRWVLYTTLLQSLKMIHPFMPFISETIYQKLPFKPKKALILEDWPKRSIR
jgi:valyl-tRNA synthetase